MENATKALLIAAAVLITILIISLGVVIYNKASESMGSMDMSAQEAQAFNDQFLKYNGTGKRGAEVNALLNTVLNNNMSEVQKNGATSEKIVSITGSSGAAVDQSTGTMTKVDAAKVYTITVKINPATSLVNEIEIN